MTTSLKIDDEMNDRIRSLARQRERTPTWIMREALRQYVDREELRDAFRQEALDAWAAYRETGRHLTATETATWLESWGNLGEGGPPDCHD